MVSVFVSPCAHPGTFHLHEGCSALKIARSYTQVDLAQVPFRKACRICVPGQPRFIKRPCLQCSGTRVPCAHNGGVLVKYVITRRYYAKKQVPAHTFTTTRYVWPDRAHLYENVDVDTVV